MGFEQYMAQDAGFARLTSRCPQGTVQDLETHSPAMLSTVILADAGFSHYGWEQKQSAQETTICTGVKKYCIAFPVLKALLLAVFPIMNFTPLCG